jgi:hypothetical protein
MPCVGFESMIPASERAKTVHALDRSATVTGCIDFTFVVSRWVRGRTWQRIWALIMERTVCLEWGFPRH